MAGVRPFATGDIPAVAQLFSRVHPRAYWNSPGECEAYFHQMFFANPWVDERLPSWVAMEGARAVGFIGVIPRPMRLRGRALQAAVVTQLMVEQENRHGLVAAQLLRKALAGPQTLTISDGANEASRRMWEALGGLTSTLYSLQWRRLLRPAQSALQRASSLHTRAAALLATPVAVLADVYAAHYRALRRPSGLIEEPLEGAALLEALERAAQRVALSPRYDEASLEWLLGHARAKRRHGELHACLLRERGGAIAGWFLYYANAATSKVLQLHAQDDAGHAVLDHLFQHAWRRGATVIEGRMEPRLARVLGQRHCLFQSTSAFALIHSRDAEVLGALARGDAFFSRLEGEWWMRFTGEPRGLVSDPSARTEPGFAPLRPGPAVLP
ncbi:MAG TPA: GNAT family N-acetyltransferase [Burkholderiales bacterium]|nr:GNAT family N-acetyltransferase [Burkholderiales bacterium]